MPKQVQPEEALIGQAKLDTSNVEWNDGSSGSDFDLEGPEVEEVEVSDDSEPAPEEVDEDEAELEAADEAEPDDPVEEEPEPEPEEVGKGASKRIQQLVAEKKAYKSQIDQLLSLQQEQLSFQRAQQQAQLQAQQAHAQEQQRLARLQALQANGVFDPTSKSDQFALSLQNDFEGAMSRVAQMEQALKQQEYARQWQEYNTKVDSSLKAALGKFEVDENDFADFRQQVVAIAVANDLADPSIAVQHVVRPLLKYMKPKAPKAPVRVARVLAEPERSALRAVASRAPAGTKKKGQKAGGARSGRYTTDSALDEMYGDKSWDG